VSFLVSPCLAAQDSWKIRNATNHGQILKQLRIAWTRGTLDTPNGPINGAIFMGGTVGQHVLSFGIFLGNPEQTIPQFHWDEYGGPDNDAALAPLLRIDVIKGKHTVSEELAVDLVAGELSGDTQEEPGQAFQATVSRRIKSNKGLLRILQAMASGSRTMRIRLRDYKDPDLVISGEFPLGPNAAKSARRLLKLCWPIPHSGPGN